MSRVLAVACLIALAGVSAHFFSTEEYEHLFVKFMQTHEKSYDAEEFFSRYNIFKANVDKIHRHNLGDHTFTMAMNQFGDLTAEEFVATHTGFKGQFKKAPVTSNIVHHHKHDSTAPFTPIDWRTEPGVVSAVKDQGQCGSCWAFSATGSTEGAWALKHKLTQSVPLSEQQLVDCATAEGNQGCEGGLMDQAFQFMIDNNGITTETAYPYKAADGTCQTGMPVASTITSFTDVTPSSDAALFAALQVGPVSIAIEADQQSFQFYSTGILTAACGAALDHGVLVVGWGVDSSLNSTAYWTIKNSWGASWGENGYIRLVDAPTLNQQTGQCGMLSVPSYPVI